MPERRKVELQMAETKGCAGASLGLNIRASAIYHIWPSTAQPHCELFIPGCLCGLKLTFVKKVTFRVSKGN